MKRTIKTVVEALLMRWRRRGFTHAGLLVVIATIRVLIASLLSVAQAAREVARRMRCGNNPKQIGLSLCNCHRVAVRSAVFVLVLMGLVVPSLADEPSPQQIREWKKTLELQKARRAARRQAILRREAREQAMLREAGQQAMFRNDALMNMGHEAHRDYASMGSALAEQARIEQLQIMRNFDAMNRQFTAQPAFTPANAGGYLQPFGGLGGPGFSSGMGGAFGGIGHPGGMGGGHVGGGHVGGHG